MAEIEEEAEHGKPKGLMTGLRCVDRRLRGSEARPPRHHRRPPRHGEDRPGPFRSAWARPNATRTTCSPSSPWRWSARTRRPHASELPTGRGEGIAYQDMSGDKLTPMQRKDPRGLLWRIPRNFIIDDTASLTVDYVKRRVWALKRRGPVGAVFIDYLQIMDRPAADRRNDAAVIGEMTKA
jgi:replicative DNA helicase